MLLWIKQITFKGEFCCPAEQADITSEDRDQERHRDRFARDFVKGRRKARNNRMFRTSLWEAKAGSLCSFVCNLVEEVGVYACKIKRFTVYKVPCFFDLERGRIQGGNYQT